MSRASFLEREPTDAEEFEVALAELLTGAISNGVNPRGNYAFRDGESPGEHSLATDILDGSHPEMEAETLPATDGDSEKSDAAVMTARQDEISHDWEIQIIALEQRGSAD